MKILLFEEEPLIREVFMKLLAEIEAVTGVKFEIMIANNVTEAQYGIQHVEIAIVDETLAGREHLLGYAERAGVSTVVMTNNPVAIEGADTSMRCILVKPALDIKKFDRAVKNFLVHRHVSRKVLQQNTPWN